MKEKILLGFLVVLMVMAFFLKQFYNDKKILTEQNNRLQADRERISAELAVSVAENNRRQKAFEEREQSLINDRKEIQNEYEKLLELKKSDAYYIPWSDVALPDSVSKLL